MADHPHDEFNLTVVAVVAQPIYATIVLNRRVVSMPDVRGYLAWTDLRPSPWAPPRMGVHRGYNVPVDRFQQTSLPKLEVGGR
jgi:hypothetical protein